MVGREGVRGRGAASGTRERRGLRARCLEDTPRPPPLPPRRWGGVQHVEGIWKRSQTRNGKLEVIHV